MSNRAVRRHPAKRAKAGKAAKPLGRSGAGREGGSGVAGRRSWRPRFFMDIFNELRKVAWPSREEIRHLTFVVVIATLFLGALLGAIDIGFGWLIDNTLLR